MNAAPRLSPDPIDAGLQRYVDFFATMTAQTLDRLDQLVTEDVHFRDPFSDTRGRERMKRIFAAMYEDCTDIGFVIDGTVRQGDEAFLKWTFRFRPRRLGRGKAWMAIGVTELHFTAAGLVRAHLDHWDSGSQFYARLPLVGPMVRFVRNRLSHA